MKISQIIFVFLIGVSCLKINSQVVVKGISPSSNTNFFVHTWAKQYMGWGTSNLNIPANSVQDTIVVVNDGTTGLNSFNIPNEMLGCNPILNNISGKIAVLFRGNCEFGIKALNAQNAGAVAVVIINNPNSAPFEMGGGTVGGNVTIPVVMINYTEGVNLIMGTNITPKVIFIGNGSSLCSPATILNSNITSCNQYITSSGQVITQSSIDIDTISNIYGCDSILTYQNITINQETTTNLNVSICYGNQYSFNGNAITSSGQYLDTLVSMTNCDSIVSLNLNVLPNLGSTFSQQICSGNSYSWFGNFYNQSGQYSHVLQSSQGCDSTITLNLVVTPPISSTINTSICPGSSYSFNGFTYTTGGTYSQTFQTQNGCDSIVYINILMLPNNFNPSLTSNQQLFTSPPFAVQFSNTTANIGNYNFTWYWGDGTSTTSNNPTVFHEYLTNGLFTVTLEATNPTTGCTDETTYTDYIFTTGGLSCTHTASINQAGPINTCAGQSVILTCNSDPSFAYQWRKNGVYIPGNNNDTLIVTQSGSYSVIISVNGCPVASTSVSVNFQSITQPTITSSGTIQPCIGGSITLTASSGYSSYLWSNGATTPTITVNASGNYTVQGTGSNGCTSTSNPYTINASFLPTQNICVVGVDSLTNNIRVVWEEPLTTAIDSFYIYKESNVSNVYTQVGSRAYDSLSVWIDPVSNPAIQSYRYKITALDTCGVETPLSDFHKTIHLTINQGVGGAWNLIWSHYEGINFGSYNIYRGTSSSNMTLLTTIQSNLNSYTDLAPPTGAVYYQIEIVNPNNCTPTKSTNYSSSKSNIATNDINNVVNISNEFISVYPNPTSAEFTIEITKGLIGEDYTITDFSGRLLRSGTFHSNKENVELDMFSNGVYLIQIKNRNIQQRIIKQ
ncbi:MAG: hypothetical protein RL259_656 [Bacteroidota bacterium]|jgi:hypothetical protein